jgi:putative FmdB family regulatory protein
MPIYEYECVPKKHRFEELQKVSARPLRKCKLCGGKVKKLVSATAFQLKGSGWYKDGYASAKPTKAESGESNKSEAATPAKATSETKPKKEKKHDD